MRYNDVVEVSYVVACFFFSAIYSMCHRSILTICSRYQARIWKFNIVLTVHVNRIISYDVLSRSLIVLYALYFSWSSRAYQAVRFNRTNYRSKTANAL